jgi:hypothetical protein
LNADDRPTIPRAVSVIGWLLCPGIVRFLWWVYSDARLGRDTSYAVAHTNLLLWIWAPGSFWLAHLWIVLVALVLLVRYRRQGWRERHVQLEVGLIASMILFGHFLFKFLPS